MKRVCGCLAAGAVAGVVLFFVGSVVMLLFGPDTNVSF